MNLGHIQTKYRYHNVMDGNYRAKEYKVTWKSYHYKETTPKAIYSRSPLERKTPKLSMLFIFCSDVVHYTTP